MTRERRMVPRERPTSYYGRPVVKRPVWTWEIPTYLFVGGTGGASSALAYAAERHGNSELARNAWKVAFGAIAISPALLFADLGRPLRFLNMLRVLKVTSPMSVGSWVLAANGAAIAPAAAGAMFEWARGPARLAQPVAAVLGVPLATYTAVLLSNTAIPAWSEARWELPVIFAAGAGASAGAIATVLTDAQQAAPARRLAIGAGAVETVAEEIMSRRLGEVGRPYREGTAGAFAKAAKALTIAGACALAAGGRSRPLAITGAGMIAVGSLCERWSVYRAGFQSAEDPAATVGPQRRRADTRAGSTA
jgi:hypothetical protein